MNFIRFYLTRCVSAFCLIAFSAGAWEAPSEAILPKAKIFPDNISRSRWLWFQSSVNTQKECFIRRQFTLNGEVKEAELFLYLDDGGEVFLNGKRIVPVPLKQRKLPIQAQKFLLNDLHSGTNTLAFHIVNTGYEGGLIFLVRICMTNGTTVYVHSDSACKAVEKSEDPRWTAPDFDDRDWKTAKSFGSVLAAPWDRVADVKDFCMTPEEKKQYADRKEEAFRLPEGLASEKESRLILQWHNDLPYFSLNGRPVSPVLFRGNPSTENQCDMLLKMSQTGVQIIECGLTTDRAELGDGTYDFSLLGQDVARTLHLYPEARICLNIYFDSLDCWCRRHPEELIGYATGPADNKTSDLWFSLDIGGRPVRPSYASRLFHRELHRFVTEFSAYVKAQPWYKRVVMIRTSYGVYSEWHYFGMGGQMPDTGKAMTEQFRIFLRGKYRTEEALRAAWKDPKISFDNAQVPGKKEREGKNRFLRDPADGTDRKVMDYYECHQLVVADALLVMAGAVKKEMPGMLVGAFYGYVFGMGNFPSEGQTLALEKVLSSPCIDFLSSPYSYDMESRGMGGVGLLRTIPGTLIRHRKLSLTELDIRTHLTKPVQYTDVTTAAESAEIFKRDLLNSALSGAGVQMVDMAHESKHKWFNAPEILSAIRENVIRIWPMVLKEKQPSDNRIAVVFNPDELVRQGYPVAKQQRFNMLLSDQQMYALYRSGYTFDLLSLRDYLLTKKEYDVTVFTNLMMTTRAEREIILRKTRGKGKCTVWIYAPGMLSEKGYSPETAKELTGIGIALTGEKTTMQLRTNDGHFIGSQRMTETPGTYAADTEGTILGYYHDGRTGMVSKQLPDGSCSVFSAVPINNAKVWARLFRDTAARPWSEPGIFIRNGTPFLLVHCGKAGSYTVRIPGDVRKVTELFSGKTLELHNSRVNLKASGCTTWLLKLEK